MCYGCIIFHIFVCRLFEDEEQDLIKDLLSLPKNVALRKLNDLIKRARLAKVITKKSLVKFKYDAVGEFYYFMIV